MSENTRRLAYVGWVMLLLIPAVRGQTYDYTWTGAVSPAWNHSGNWSSSLGGYPDSSTVVVKIVDADNDPVIDYDQWIEVGTLHIQSGLLTVTVIDDVFTPPNAASRLSIVHRDGLKIDSGARLVITRASRVEIAGGGELNLGGEIEFQNGNFDGHPGILRLSGVAAENYLIVTRNGGGAIVGTDPGMIDARHHLAVLVLEPGNTVKGHVTIEAPFFNNGLVHADRAGTGIALSCHPKGGAGTWKVSHADARLTVDVPVLGSVCSKLEITAGIVDVRAAWVSCGKLEHQGGKVDVAAEVPFEIGRCSENAANQQTCGS